MVRRERGAMSNRSEQLCTNLRAARADHGLSQEVAHIGEWEYRLDHARALRDEAPEITPAAPMVVAP